MILNIANTFSVMLICMCLFVVFKWCRPICSYAKKYAKGESLDSYDWLVLGVFVSFLSKSLDSSYWLIPWTLKALESEHTAYFMAIGINFNLVFRIILGGFAAYCHIKSIYLHGMKKSQSPRVVMSICLLVAMCYLFIVCLTK